MSQKMLEMRFNITDFSVEGTEWYSTLLTTEAYLLSYNEPVWKWMKENEKHKVIAMYAIQFFEWIEDPTFWKVSRKRPLFK